MVALVCFEHAHFVKKQPHSPHSYNVPFVSIWKMINLPKYSIMIFYVFWKTRHSGTSKDRNIGFYWNPMAMLHTCEWLKYLFRHLRQSTIEAITTIKLYIPVNNCMYNKSDNKRICKTKIMPVKWVTNDEAMKWNSSWNKIYIHMK